MNTNTPPTVPLEENYGDYHGSSPGVPNDPSGKKGADASDKVIGAAAIAGGVAGLVIAGPLVGIAGAAGAGILATQKGTAGEVARASGDVVISAGERAKKIDQKHHVVDKTKKATHDLVQKGKEIDQKHHVVDKTKNAVKGMVEETKKFEKKHHFGAKAGKGMKDGLNFLSEKIKPKPKSTQ